MRAKRKKKGGTTLTVIIGGKVAVFRGLRTSRYYFTSLRGDWVVLQNASGRTLARKKLR